MLLKYQSLKQTCFSNSYFAVINMSVLKELGLLTVCIMFFQDTQGWCFETSDFNSPLIDTCIAVQQSSKAERDEIGKSQVSAES